MPTAKRLIVNADDFGRSAGVNAGIIEAHERGIVTSASLMVRGPAAGEAAAYGRRRSSLGLGLHFDLGEWMFRDGEWTPLYAVVALDDAAAVAEEIARQLTAFRRLVGRNPTHLNSHQHVHLREPACSMLLQVAYELGIPLRHFCPYIRNCGGFYGQTADGAPLPDAIGVDGQLAILVALPEGITELACHPGDAVDNLETMYRSERAQELKTLRNPRIWSAIQKLGINLCSFADAIATGHSLIRSVSGERREW